jgi:hypothetical protein
VTPGSVPSTTLHLVILLPRSGSSEVIDDDELQRMKSRVAVS